METKVFKGDKVKDPILFKVQHEITAWNETVGQRPGIAFIGYMNVPLGKYNIPFHVKSAEALGFNVYNLVQPDSTGEEELLKVIDQANENPDIHAIELLQPLPHWINPLKTLSRIKPEKEAEGFHPENMMHTLFPGYRDSDFTMCLPAALKYIFSFYKYQVRYASEWVLVLDHEFYENPLVNMVARTAMMASVPSDSTLSVISTTSPVLGVTVKRADYLVVVSKKPGIIQPEWLKPGVGIIDIYSNLTDEVPAKNDPQKLVPVIMGGVDTESVNGIASFIVPVPGGLMPVVLAIMFRNVLKNFVRQLQTKKRFLNV
jgi:methylenetetrahydrofolate dehydrogenase (NADP+)/methenyltetrahydrofolate cyclohydrolase